MNTEKTNNMNDNKNNTPPNLVGVEEILEDENNLLTLDNTIEFKCRGCGKCCIETTDIILSPIDIYNLSKQLKISSEEVITQYGDVIQGGSTKMPIVLLKRDKNNKCLLLKDNKCMVHQGKPGSCYLYPLGRVIMKNPDDGTSSQIKYFMQKDLCRKYKVKTIKIRDYIGDKYISQEQACINWLTRYGDLYANTIGLFNEFIDTCKPYIQNTVLSTLIEVLYIGLEEINEEDDLVVELEKRYSEAENLLKEAVEIRDYYDAFSQEKEDELVKTIGPEKFLEKLLKFVRKYKRKGE